MEEKTTEKPLRKSGAQRKREWANRTRVLRDGVWRLDIWKPHPRVLRGKPRKEGGE